MSLRSGSLQVTSAALIAVALWGASSVATKLAITALPPLAVAILRTVLAGVVALPLAVVLRVAPPRRTTDRWSVAMLAVSGFVAFSILFSLGLNLTSSVHGAMILAMLPIATGALALVWDRRRPSRAWLSGCTIAAAGEAVLILGREGSGGATASIAGDVLVLLSILFGALGNVTGGRLQQAGYPAKAATLWGAVLATAILCPVLPWVARGVVWHLVTPTAWVGVAYLAFGVTILGYALWYWALGHGDIAQVGLLQFLQPVTGVFLAWVLLDEGLTGTLLLATMLVLLGVWIATPRASRHLQAQ